MGTYFTLRANSSEPVMVIRDTKKVTEPPFDSEFWRSGDNTSVLAWVDYTDLKNPIVTAALKVSNTAVECIQVPINTVKCSTEEEFEGRV